MNYRKTVAFITGVVSCASVISGAVSETGIVINNKIYAEENSSTSVVSRGCLEDSYGSTVAIYELYDNGELVITGHGSINSRIPDAVKSEVKSVRFESDETGSVEEIENDLFSKMENLESIELPEEFVYIPERMFEGCTSLVSVKIPENLNNIGTGAFRGCTSLTEIVIPDSVTLLGTYAFEDCTGLKKVKIGKGIEVVVPYVFSNCPGIEEMTVSDLRAPVLDPIFAESSLIIDSDTGRMSVRYMFSDKDGLTECNVRKLIISEGTSKISDCEFSEMSTVTEVVIPETVEKISEKAFSNCTYLQKAVMQKGIKEIGQLAFFRTSLKEIHFSGTFEEFGKVSISAGNDKIVSAKICTSDGENMLSPYHPAASMSAEGDFTYTLDDNGELVITGHGFIRSGFPAEIKPKVKSIRFEPDETGSINVIDDKMFTNMKNLEHIDLPEGLFAIGTTAFEGCESLTSVKLPETLNIISPDAFKGCTALTEIEIPDSVTSLGTYAFANCTGLKKVKIGKGIEVVVPHVFSNCLGIEEMTVSDIRTPFMDSALSKKMSLKYMFANGGAAPECNVKKLIVSEGTKKISDCEFSEMSSVTEVVIPGTVDKISTGAFSYCGHLQKAVLQNGIREIGSAAFVKTSIEKIYFPESLEKLDKSLFMFNNSLSDIYWPGDEDSWKSVSYGNDFGFMANVTIHYNYKDEADETEKFRGDGDVNGDGKADITDLSYISLYIIGDIELDDVQYIRADIDKDGVVKLADLATLRMKLSHITE